MSDVKTTVRTLKVFEAFASHLEPMTLSELATRIGSPPSSCLLIIRTLLSRGYLHVTGRHQTYYPTSRLLGLANQIAKHDPLLKKALPILHGFRDEIGETFVLAKRQGDKLVYLASAESNQVVRVVVPPGTLRPLHSNATGKALLSTLSEAERKRLLHAQRLTEMTSKTITDPDILNAAIQDSATRGYFTNFGEGAAELSSVSAPLTLQGESYALSILAPSSRLDSQMDQRGEQLLGFARTLEMAFQITEPDAATAPRRPRVVNGEKLPRKG